MADSPAPAMILPQDRDLRRLTVAGGLAIALTLLAIIAVVTQGASYAPKPDVQPLFPGAAERVADVARVTVQTADGTIEAVRGADGRWVLPGKGGYPAALEPLRAAFGILTADRIEPRTSDPAWHVALDLRAPDDTAQGESGRGTLVTLADGAGNTIASLIVGKLKAQATATEPGQVYVRRPGEDQTWLARGRFAAQPDAAQWVDRTFPAIARDDIQGVRIDPVAGPAYSLSRTAPGTDFTIDGGTPPGRATRGAEAAAGIATILASFTIADVMPAAEAQLADANTAVFTTFDGVVITVTVGKMNEAFWATLSASPGAGADGTVPPAAAERAAAINAAASGWAFQVTNWFAAQAAAPLENILLPEAPAPQP